MLQKLIHTIRARRATRKAARSRYQQRLFSSEKLEDRNLFAVYYIDPVNGNDNAQGTSQAAAFRTFANVSSQYNLANAPANWRPLNAGDEIVLMRGSHNYSYLYDTENRPGQYESLFLRNVHGTPAQPIIIRGMDGALVRSLAPNGTEMSPIKILSSSNIVIAGGLDVTAFGSAIVIADSTNVTVRSTYIHDVNAPRLLTT